MKQEIIFNLLRHRSLEFLIFIQMKYYIFKSQILGELIISHLVYNGMKRHRPVLHYRNHRVGTWALLLCCRQPCRVHSGLPCIPEDTDRRNRCLYRYTFPRWDKDSTYIRQCFLGTYHLQQYITICLPNIVFFNDLLS